MTKTAKKTIKTIVVLVLLAVIIPVVYFVHTLLLPIMIRINDNVLLTHDYMYCQEYPYSIYKKAQPLRVDGKTQPLRVDGFLLAYNYNDDYLIALLQDYETRDSIWCIINLNNDIIESFDVDSLFSQKLYEKQIEMRLKEFPRYYKNVRSQERWVEKE